MMSSLQLELNNDLSGKMERLVARIPVEVGVARAAEERACALEAELASERERGTCLEQELDSVKLERDQALSKLAELENRFQELQNELESKRLESEPENVIPEQTTPSQRNSELIPTPQSSKSDVYKFQRFSSHQSPLQRAHNPQVGSHSIPVTPTRPGSKPEPKSGNRTSSCKVLSPPIPKGSKLMEEQLTAVVSELASHATPLNYGFSPDSIPRPMAYKLKSVFEPDSVARNANVRNGYETDSLERSPPPPPQLLNQSLTGLKHAFQLINSLSTFNLSLQQEVARLSNENTVSTPLC